jgi:hypothetical protein
MNGDLLAFVVFMGALIAFGLIVAPEVEEVE